MLEYYKSFKPPIKNIHWLIENCEFVSK